jgi:nucleoside-diphosphate kinase
MERTLSIIKPEVVRKNKIGAIISMIEEAGLKIIAMKMIHLSKEKAKIFYGVHKDREFFPSLIEYITSGPIVAMVIEGEDAIERLRKLMGSTDPQKAEPNTIRRIFGTNIQNNAIHGSDSKKTAEFEISSLFPELDK